MQDRAENQAKDDQVPSPEDTVAHDPEVTRFIPHDAAQERTQHLPSDSDETTSSDNQTRGIALHPQKIGPYRITGFLAHGGMALVYSAVDTDGAPVALKVIQENPFLPRTLITRFLREAEATKKLRRHRNIITVYDTGEFEGTHYIAMELVPGGRTLDQLLKKKEFTIKEALTLGLAVAKALAFAHQNGIIHRDLKPANVLIDEFEEALLADFGLARFSAGTEENLTLTATSLGTPRYMAPEQTVSAKHTDHRADLYSFGVLLYELLTGKLPYIIDKGMGMAEVFDQIRHQNPVPPQKIRKEISRDLTAVLFKLLEKEPERRYQTADQVVDDLEACLSGGRVSVRVPSVFEKFERFLLRKKWTALVVAATTFTMFNVVRWYNKQLQLERESAIIPQARNTSDYTRLADLTGKGSADALSPSELSVSRAYAAVIAGDLALAEVHLNELAASISKNLKVSDLPAEDWDQVRLSVGHTSLNQVAWEKARLRLAAADFDAARRQFSDLSKEPFLLPVQRQFLQFEEGLALFLSGQKQEATDLWQTLHNKNIDSNLLLLCDIGLENRAAPELAEECKNAPPVFQALGFFLLAQSTTNPESQQLWQKAALRQGKDVLPWISYYIENRHRPIE